MRRGECKLGPHLRGFGRRGDAECRKTCPYAQVSCSTPAHMRPQLAFPLAARPRNPDPTFARAAARIPTCASFAPRSKSRPARNPDPALCANVARAVPASAMGGFPDWREHRPWKNSRVDAGAARATACPEPLKEAQRKIARGPRDGGRAGLGRNAGRCGQSGRFPTCTGSRACGRSRSAGAARGRGGRRRRSPWPSTARRWSRSRSSS